MQNPNIPQVLKTLKEANCVLVTVKNSPTVDELAAAIALTLMLNHLNKHAVTVFSGRVPSMLEFLQPEMAIDTTTDSLRDFIIALDKSKADKLRYKVEDNVVRIFITPYKSSITEKDLEFSQGEFNVDAVVALGVVTKEDFDQAVTTHGRILHDATVVALTNQNTVSQIGAINWQEQPASSICEMVAMLTDGLGPDVLDAQVATALMTGIIAETDRFRNAITTPEVMSISAKLMTAGANQQLIAEKLEEPDMSSVARPLSYDEVARDKDDGALEIVHDEDEVQNIHIDDSGNLALPAEPEEEMDPLNNDLLNHEEMPPFEQIASLPAAISVNEEVSQLPTARSYMESAKQPQLYAEDDSGRVSAQPLLETPPLLAPQDQVFGPSQMSSAPLEPRHKVIAPIPSGEEHGSYGRQFVPPAEVPAPTLYDPNAPPPAPLRNEPEPAVSSAPPIPSSPQSAPVAPVTENAYIETPAPPIMAEPGQTLSDLEHKIGSPHVTGEDNTTNSVDDFLGTTRTAAEEQPKEQPEPITDEKQQETKQEEKQEEAPKTDVPNTQAPTIVDPNAPPEVPPPLMPAPTQPQFYDQDGNSANPFLNPN
jgi:hypothetical protein